MSNLLKDHQYLAVGAAAVIGFGSGILFKDWHYKLQVKNFLMKCYCTDDELQKYASRYTQPTHPVEEKLMKESTNRFPHKMRKRSEVNHFLAYLIQVTGVKRVIEADAFTGVGTLGFALALPEDGKIIACEKCKEMIEIGKTYWEEAGVCRKIELMHRSLGDLLDGLLQRPVKEHFDFVVFDAKEDDCNENYEKCLKLVRQQGIIAIKNIFHMIEDDPSDRTVKKIKDLNKKLRHDPRIDISIIVIGDGLTLAFKR